MYYPNRREALKQSAVGFGSIALAGLLADQSKAAVIDPLAAKPPHFTPKAKRMIFLFMKGGPSHVDTFEQKTMLDRDHGKPFPYDKPKVQFAPTGNLLKSPWKFSPHGQCGHMVSELFPNVARHVDDICFLHGLHGTNAAHGGALLKLHTGSDNFVRPSIGSWVTYGLGSENSSLPGFVTICPTLAHGGVTNWGSAFLPAAYQGTPLGNASVSSKNARVAFINNDKVSSQLQQLQLNALQKSNREFMDTTGPDQALEGRIASFELAFRMQNEMPKAEDLSQESEATRALYGLNDPITENFGRQCLMARRFLERGVRYVQVSHSDAFVQWDQHGDLKKGHTKNALEVDRPIAALLYDLKQRGLLEDTLVWWGGEFGRTPTAQGSGDGRDHNPEGFTMWLAGGGVKGGYSHGATDDYGFFAEKGKVHIHDMHATILHLMGLDHERLTFKHAGRDFRLTDVHGRVIDEVIA
ncbi:MAG: DUF1501 domain-containing protein, partial [Gemmataceae bacterium]|jgi:Protein of unknown function (DUF1501)|nr:DUF1501 domain-containing protein [Gemmataceae bacterium]RLS56117.1 MAG: DUF1501 domain-containing protein [Planctomycetota bacterium]